MGLLGMTSFAGMTGSQAVIQAIQAEMVAATVANAGVGSALTPPGTEGASVKAVATQVGNTQAYTAAFAAGLEQIEELITFVQSGNTAVELADLGSAI